MSKKVKPIMVKVGPGTYIEVKDLSKVEEVKARWAKKLKGGKSTEHITPHLGGRMKYDPETKKTIYVPVNR